MIRPKRILTVLDPRPGAQPAAERGAWLAKRLNAELELYVCDYDPRVAGRPLVGAKALERARRLIVDRHLRDLERLAADFSSQGINVSFDACWGHPLHEAVMAKADAGGADLVVKHTQSDATTVPSILSNTDWHLINSCRSPLMLVKGRGPSRQPRMVAAVDPMHLRDKPAELDDRIVAAADTLCAALDGRLSVFHAVDVSAALAVSADAIMTPLANPLDEITAEVEARHREALLELTDRHAIDRQQVYLYRGRPRDLLVAFAEQHAADVVVMGAVSRSGLGRPFLGSTAEQVLGRLPCDLLIVKLESGRISGELDEAASVAAGH
jgi:universal stress protein E